MAKTIKKLLIEIADTSNRRALGLMNRKSLAENAGMLFKFPQSNYLSFWMKSTYLPLEIAFLEDDGTIFQISEMYPLSTRAIVANKPCKMALEVNQGWFSKNDIGIGDTIRGINKLNRQHRMAQATPMMGENVDEAFPLDGGDQTDPNASQNPIVEVILNDREKVRQAERNNLTMQIVYQSKGSGETLPPRKLMPVPGEGYPIRVGEGGEYFVAFDASPTIDGGDWTILGNQIKRFLFSNIIALEVINEFSQSDNIPETTNNQSQQKGII